MQDQNDRRTKRISLYILCACLICAVLGGIAGFVTAKMAGSQFDQRLSALESAFSRGVSDSMGSAEELPVGTILSGSQIYELACKQTVAIKTEYNTVNLFGVTTPKAVSGSGFIISDDGYILTNYHVIESAARDDSSVSVLFHDGSSYEASVAGVEQENDLALLKIDGEGLTAAAIGDSDTISVGEPVFAVGNPLGELSFSQTSGTVSALNRDIDATIEGQSYSVNMFQIDAAINSGNSGGPVYNSHGEVIGVVTAKYYSSGIEGIGFAIPINDAMRIANELKLHGYVTGKPDLGAETTDVTSGMAAYYGIAEGAYVDSVTPSGSADRAGLAQGDVITAIDSKNVTCQHDLEETLKAYRAGDTAELTVIRNGNTVKLSIIFDEVR